MSYCLDLLKEKDVAKMLGVSVITIRRWRRIKNGLKFCRLGDKAIRYRVEDVHAFVEGGIQC